MKRGPTLGVEEEYFLLDPRTARTLPIVDRVMSSAADSSDGEPRRLSMKTELFRTQLEIATAVCSELEEVRTIVADAREWLGKAAMKEGAVLAPLGTAPTEPDEAEISPDERCGQLYERSPELVREQLVCAMHVHVEVPDRATGVSVLNRLRPWLHVLVALSANSPFWRGRDTGFASWRTIHTRRWPVDGPPPRFRDPGEYDRHVDWLIRTGVILDRAQLYWSMRLSHNYPTVEIRVSDVPLTVDGTVMIAGLARALVARAVRDIDSGAPEPKVTREAVRQACWHAARHGPGAELLDLTTSGPVPRLRPAAGIVDRLLDHLHVITGLRAEVADVLPTITATLAGAGGADTQRRAVAAGGFEGLLALLAADV
jgi:glutamate---cysteine ligase / carboxylate-amine ligase